MTYSSTYAGGHLSPPFLFSKSRTIHFGLEINLTFFGCMKNLSATKSYQRMLSNLINLQAVGWDSGILSGHYPLIKVFNFNF